MKRLLRSKVWDAPRRWPSPPGSVGAILVSLGNLFLPWDWVDFQLHHQSTPQLISATVAHVEGIAQTQFQSSSNTMEKKIEH